MWLACDEHRESLETFLGARGFLKDTASHEPPHLGASPLVATVFRKTTTPSHLCLYSRAVRRLVLPVSLALGLVLSGALPAHARGDTDPPVLAAFDFNPKTVNVKAAGKVVTVTIRTTDATATSNPIVTLTSDNSLQQVGPTGMTWDSGSPVTNSVWTADLTIPQGAAPGTWTVTVDTLVDVLGNPQSSPNIHPTKLTVTNPGATRARPC